MFYFKLTSITALLLCAHMICAQSEITTEKLIITDGATTNFVLKSDAIGNASWADPSTLFSGVSTNWSLSGNDIYNNNSGSIGIGTTSPTAPLDVIGTIRANVIQTRGQSIQINRLGTGDRNAFLDFHTTDATTAMNARIIRNAGENGHFIFENEGIGDMIFRVADANRMFLTDTGNFGIGISTPQSRLHVNGELRSGIIRTDDTRIEINEFGSGDRNAILDFHGSDEESDFSARVWRVAGENGNFRIENRGAGNLLFRTSNVNRAAIQPDGKFIVGPQTTATPGNYNLYVVNGILTERVKIATVGTSDWADYVFEDDYKLHTLEEVAEFVKEHKHLPNVPSATDVEKNGYELQQMDSKLLEKIEELYLLTIELNEEKNDLKKENDLLKKSIQESNKIHQQTLQTIMSRLDKLENK